MTHLQCKTQALSLVNEVLRCTLDSFDHPRLWFLKYFLGVRLRKIYPRMYNNNAPHALTVDAENPYMYSLQTFNSLKEKISPIVPFVPSTKQVYLWLLDILALPEFASIKHPNVPKDQQANVWKTVRDKRLSARHQDFVWRLVTGALKTGEVIKKWNIAGAQTQCLFCHAALETPRHLFVECPSLLGTRAHVKSLVQQLFRIDIDVNSEKVMLLGLLDHTIRKGATFGCSNLGFFVVTDLRATIFDFLAFGEFKINGSMSEFHSASNNSVL